MAENSGIAWTTHTFNPWIGCTKVGPGCDSCYAEALAARRLGVAWGAGAPRRRTKEANWNKVRKWNRGAARTGFRPWVFVASLADVFDNEVDERWRRDLLELFVECRNLNFQLVTKRIGNAERMLPRAFGVVNPHVGIVATVVTQKECDRDLGKLLSLKDYGYAGWVGLSIEPQLERVIPKISEGLDWAITGGESDQGARRGRPYMLQWPQALIDWGYEANVDIYVKQVGSAVARILQLKDSAGADPEEWPVQLRVRQMPRGVLTTMAAA